MSHIVTIQTQVRDSIAVHEACRRLQWQPPLQGTHRIFSRQVQGLAVFAPEWKFPIVCELSSGTIRYDNYQGHWGDPVHLDRFKQAYAVEKTKIEARRQGRTVTEKSLAKGSIQLTLMANGG